MMYPYSATINIDAESLRDAAQLIYCIFPDHLRPENPPFALSLRLEQDSLWGECMSTLR